jgi:hypothetical protein
MSFPSSPVLCLLLLHVQFSPTSAEEDPTFGDPAWRNRPLSVVKHDAGELHREISQGVFVSDEQLWHGEG